MAKTKRVKRGRGIINEIIDKWPLNTTYGNFCGPQQNSEELMKHNVPPKSILDSHCRNHDRLYIATKDPVERAKADKILMDAAWQRATAPDTPLGERIASFATAGAMKAKQVLGQGIKKKRKRGLGVRKRKRKARRIGSAFYLKQYRSGAGKLANLKCKKKSFLK